MAHAGQKHYNPHTGLLCECPWGGLDWQHTASIGVRRLRNQNMKIFRDARGQAFLDRLDRMLDQYPEAEPMAPWFAAQFKQGNLEVSDAYDPEGYNSGIVINGDFQIDLRNRLPLWGQWMQAGQHRLRRGVNIMELGIDELTRVARELNEEVAEKQTRDNWLEAYGEYSTPEHVFGPEAGEHQGWQVHHISDGSEAAAESEALGHCIGSEEQPYLNAIENGLINAWSLRDPEGYPHVSWHHNPSGGLAHIQGKSGYPKSEYRDLITQFNNMKELDDGNGGAGMDNLEEIQEEEYDYYVEGPPVRDIEDYVRYYGSDGWSNIMDYAYNSGRYNLPEDGDYVEAEPGPISWDEIAREAEDMHAPDKWGYDPDNISHVEQYELDDLHGTIENNNHETYYEKAIGGLEWNPGSVDHYNTFEDVARAPNAMAAWLDHKGWLDEDWIPLNDERRKQVGVKAPEFPQQPQPPAGPPAPAPPGQVTLFSGRKAGKRAQLANILDPIHEELDSTVFDDPASPSPKLKTKHRNWIRDSVYRILDGAGYDGMDEWLQLVFTGSLTTYQYSPDSDVDVSLFVNVDKFPEWSRAEMIGVMVEHMDGTKLPGTTHPMQCFVVPSDVDVTDLYKPGLRSGYDLESEVWIVPPEKGRVHDVEREMNAAYVHALEQADKMDRLLKYEPDKAIMFWHQIHKRRRRDHQAGKGDYSDSNITYKMLANRGLFPQISELSGEYIAKTAKPRGWTAEEHRTQTAQKLRAARMDLWHDAFLKGVSPYEHSMTKADVLYPAPWSFNEKLIKDELSRRYQRQVPGEHFWNRDQTKYRWDDEEEARFHQDYQAQVKDWYQNDPNAMTHEYENWQEWYQQHAPQQHWDPEGWQLDQPAPVPTIPDRPTFSAVLPSAEEIKRVQEEFELRYPVRVLPSFEGRGGYAGISRDPFTGKDSHLIYVNPERQHGARNWALWHEIGHAKRVEDGGEFTPNDHLTDEEYRNSPNEQHAEEFASQHADWDLWRNS